MVLEDFPGFYIYIFIKNWVFREGYISMALVTTVVRALWQTGP
jgi:hypothetical protein